MSHHSADPGEPAGSAGRCDGDGGADARHHHQLPREAGQGPHTTRYGVILNFFHISLDANPLMVAYEP